MKVRPLTLKQAQDYIQEFHRHHKKPTGHRFSLGLFLDKKLVGVCVIGRPVARETDQYSVAEVTRLCTNGTKNACSKLYGAAARVCREMGFKSIQTYILETEPGNSLLATGWEKVLKTKGGSWNCPSRKRKDQHPTCIKIKYEKVLNG